MREYNMKYFLPQENEAWKTYVKGPLEETNSRNKVNFGGRDPREPVIPVQEEPKEEGNPNNSGGMTFSDPESKKEFMKKFHEMIRMKKQPGNMLKPRQIIQNHEQEHANQEAENHQEEDSKKEKSTGAELHNTIDSGNGISKSIIKMVHDHKDKEKEAIPDSEAHAKNINILPLPPRIDMIEEPDQDILWFSEPSETSIEAERDREIEDPDFYDNNFFKLSGEWHSAEDILREIEN